MDDKTALAVWAQFRERVTTTGVSEASALIQFTQWVQEKAAHKSYDPDTAAVESRESA